MPLFRVASTAAIKHNFFQTRSTPGISAGLRRWFSSQQCLTKKFTEKLRGLRLTISTTKCNPGDDASLHGDCIG